MFASLAHKTVSTAKIQSRSPRARLEVENLEDRMVPSTLLAEHSGGGQVEFSVTRGSKGEEIPSLNRTADAAAMLTGTDAQTFRRIGEEIPTLTGGKGGISGDTIFGTAPEITGRLGEEIPTPTGGRGGIFGDCAFDSHTGYAQASAAVFGGNDGSAGASAGEMTVNGFAIGEEIPW